MDLVLEGIRKDQEKDRKFGVRSKLPKFLRDVVVKIKSRDPEEIMALLRLRCQQMLDLHQRTTAEDALMKGQMPKHLQEVYKSKNLAFLVEMVRISCHLDEEMVSFAPRVADQLRDHLVNGVRLSGVIPRMYFWDEVEKDMKGAEEIAARAWRSFINRPKTPPADTWADNPDHIAAMHRDAEKCVQKGLWVEVERESWEAGELPFPPALAFPVEQPNKIRTCIDMRPLNRTAVVTERMRLVGPPGHLEVIQLCAAGSASGALPTVFQTKRDINEDIKSERALLAQLREEVDGAEALVRDVRPQDDREGWAFVPTQDAFDLEGYYYQWGVDTPELNTIMIPCGKENSRAKRSWRVFKSYVSLFGALGSVYIDVSFSECTMRVFSAFLEICCPIYIDDGCVFSRPQCAEPSLAAAMLFLLLVNIVVAGHKSESTRAIARLITLLGLGYQLSKDRTEISVNIPAIRRQQCGQRIARFQSDLMQGEASLDELLSIRGVFRWCAFLSVRTAGLSRGLDFWVGEWKNLIKNKAQRKKLFILLGMMSRSLLAIRPATLSIEKGRRRRWLVYGDAACENQVEMRNSRDPKDCSKYGIWIGAILFPCGEGSGPVDPIGFSLQIKQVPGWVRAVSHIGIWEALTVFVGNRVFREAVPGYSEAFVVQHVDNMGDCFALVKGSSPDLVTQAITSAWHEDLEETDSDCYVGWISTHRNAGDNFTRMQKFDAIKAAFPTLKMIPVSESMIDWSRLAGIFESYKSVRPEGSGKRKKAKREHKKRTGQTETKDNCPCASRAPPGGEGDSEAPAKRARTVRAQEGGDSGPVSKQRL